MYRDHRLACLTCGAELEDAGACARCPACRGVWISEDSLTQMVWEIHNGLERQPLDWQPHERAARRACLECQQPMDNVTVEGIPVERCGKHGIWLDPGEHQETLRRAAERPPTLAPGEKRQMSLWHAFKMLFEDSSTSKGIRSDHVTWVTRR